ncbi:hypothetical protein EAS54_35845 [Bradyrhizobium guangzhouense]|nr:hypothetical protein EAS54_35845 [Bradyrhizobium guangzhouense]
MPDARSVKGLLMRRTDLKDLLELTAPEKLSSQRRCSAAIWVGSAFHPDRRATRGEIRSQGSTQAETLCPTCGKPMTAVPDDEAPGRPGYVCLACGGDPLHDPAARKWADSPLWPPSK